MLKPVKLKRKVLGRDYDREETKTQSVDSVQHYKDTIPAALIVNDQLDDYDLVSPQQFFIQTKPDE